MQLAIRKPRLSILPIVLRLLEDKALEEGEEYDYIPIEPLEPKGAGGPDTHSTPKKKDEPVATALATVQKSVVTGASADLVCHPVRDEEHAAYLCGPTL